MAEDEIKKEDEKMKFMEVYPINENNPVRKANDLIEGNYKLSQAESKIMDTVISLMPESAESLDYIEIATSDLCNFCHVNLSDLKKATNNIVKKSVWFIGRNKNGESEEIQASWLASSVYYASRGVVRLRVSPELKPYLLGLRRNKKPYTEFAIKELVGATYYTKRIYELACQWKSIGRRPKMSIYDLRKMLGIEPGKYETFSSFRVDVLDRAITDIAENDSMAYEVSYETYRQGRKISEIAFFCKKKKQVQATDPAAQSAETKDSSNGVIDFSDMSLEEVKAYLLSKRFNSSLLTVLTEDQLKYLADMIEHQVNVVVLNRFVLSHGFEYVKENNEIALKRFANGGKSYGALFFTAVNNDFASEEKAKEKRKPKSKAAFDIQKFEEQEKKRIQEEREKREKIPLVRVSDFEIDRLNASVEKHGTANFGACGIMLKRYADSTVPKIVEALKIWESGKKVPTDFFNDED